jgi:hypothetical protein
MTKPTGPITIALIGAAIGLLFAAVRAFANRGDIGLWEWIALPALVALLLLWLAGNFDESGSR